MAPESKRPGRPSPQGAFGGGAKPGPHEQSERPDAPAQRKTPPPAIEGLGFGASRRAASQPDTGSPADVAGPAETQGERRPEAHPERRPEADAQPGPGAQPHSELQPRAPAQAHTEAPTEVETHPQPHPGAARIAATLAQGAPPPPKDPFRGMSFPPVDDSAGAEEVVLGEIAANSTDRTRSSRPPPLGYAEGHDAWTVERMSRQSTVPPQAGEDLSRLRELSAQRISELPNDLFQGGALDLVDHSRPSVQLDLVGEMEELYALDDLTGALRFAELILGREPQNTQAKRCADNCRARLVRLYSSKIGDMALPVSLALEDAELRWLGLDHRSGFLLSRVDGFSSVEELLDICGMPRLEALKTLVELLERGAIKIG